MVSSARDSQARASKQKPADKKKQMKEVNWYCLELKNFILFVVLYELNANFVSICVCQHSVPLCQCFILLFLLLLIREYICIFVCSCPVMFELQLVDDENGDDVRIRFVSVHILENPTFYVLYPIAASIYWTRTCSCKPYHAHMARNT